MQWTLELCEELCMYCWRYKKQWSDLHDLELCLFMWFDVSLSFSHTHKEISLTIDLSSCREQRMTSFTQVKVISFSCLNGWKKKVLTEKLFRLPASAELKTSNYNQWTSFAFQLILIWLSYPTSLCFTSLTWKSTLSQLISNKLSSLLEHHFFVVYIKNFVL